jgi:hypothetical protein
VSVRSCWDVGGCLIVAAGKWVRTQVTSIPLTWSFVNFLGSKGKGRL